MGRDKATIVVDGVTLAERTAALLATVAAPVVEVGPGYTGLPIVAEDPPGLGPLAALAAGAGYMEGVGYQGPVVVLATDLPRLTAGLVALLATFPCPGCVVPMDRGRSQPLCARYSGAALREARRLVSEGKRSMRDLLDRVDVRWLPEPEWVAAAGRPDALVDVDTPEDLRGLRAR
jgi:molybdopterin-guanine dinucleotide biosynthesis protein A